MVFEFNNHDIKEALTRGCTVPWWSMVVLSLGPRPKTNPSADRFQFPARYTGSDMHTGWGLGTRLGSTLKDLIQQLWDECWERLGVCWHKVPCVPWYHHTIWHVNKLYHATVATCTLLTGGYINLLWFTNLLFTKDRPSKHQTASQKGRTWY